MLISLVFCLQICRQAPCPVLGKKLLLWYAQGTQTSVCNGPYDGFASYAPGAGIAIQSDSYPGPEPITLRDHLY